MMLHGDALTVLKTLPSESVQCCVTSPPYYGLRDYGVDGQIGLEKTPDEFIARLVAVFSEVRRVLKPDGTLWVNIGDSYAANRSKQVSPTKWKDLDFGESNASRVPEGLKPKDLIGIPWMLAFALRSEGWWLRQDIIWHKPNPMPESVQDRCTKAHEYVFLFSKSQRYRFDGPAIAEAGSLLKSGNTQHKYVNGQHLHRTKSGFLEMRGKVYESVNRRSVWTIVSMPTPEAHFATFPIELPELCIKASTGPGDTVLDPFAGAGTTWLACLKHGREFVGIELNEEYIRIAESRTMKHYPLLVQSSPDQNRTEAQL